MIERYRKIKVKTWTLVYKNSILPIDNSIDIEHWNHPDCEEYLQLYKAVGDSWGWTERLLMTRAELYKKLQSVTNEVWHFRVDGQCIGFFEIDKSEPGQAEIVYLGLIPEAIGKGYGKRLLNTAVQIAGLNNDKVWLHTCEFDHQNALNAYQKAGFEVIDESLDEAYYSIVFIKKHSK